MKGILLAGGGGTRLYPSTKVISKQLLPVYDKPLIYYSLSTLMLAGIREIMIISNPEYLKMYEDLLGDGTRFGISLSYEKQLEPRGIAEAIIIASSFLQSDSFALILGDNIFHGTDLGTQLSKFRDLPGATIFGYWVSNPQEYGVVELDEKGRILSVEEKPVIAKSNLAIPGLYFFDHNAITYASQISPSFRGELEITSVIERYALEKSLKVSVMPRGVMWMDTGTPNGLHDASTYVRLVEERQGLKVNCPEEVAYHQGWISMTEVKSLAQSLEGSSYGSYLHSILER